MLVMAYFRVSPKGVEIAMSLQSQGSHCTNTNSPPSPLQLLLCQHLALACAISLFAASHLKNEHIVKGVNSQGSCLWGRIDYLAGWREIFLASTWFLTHCDNLGRSFNLFSFLPSSLFVWKPACQIIAFLFPVSPSLHRWCHSIIADTESKYYSLWVVSNYLLFCFYFVTSTFPFPQSSQFHCSLYFHFSLSCN